MKARESVFATHFGISDKIYYRSILGFLDSSSGYLGLIHFQEISFRNVPYDPCRIEPGPNGCRVIGTRKTHPGAPNL